MSNLVASHIKRRHERDVPLPHACFWKLPLSMQMLPHWVTPALFKNEPPNEKQTWSIKNWFLRNHRLNMNTEHTKQITTMELDKYYSRVVTLLKTLGNFRSSRKLLQSPGYWKSAMFQRFVLESFIADTM